MRVSTVNPKKPKLDIRSRLKSLRRLTPQSRVAARCPNLLGSEVNTPMSIVASVKVYDGIVLGSESMTQLWGQAQPGVPQLQFVKAFSNARKLFQLGSLPFGVLAYGAGNITNRSIESFLYEFNDQLLADAKHAELTGEAIAKRLIKFMQAPYEAAFAHLSMPQRPVLGFYLAGYSPKQHLGTEWEFVLPQNDQPFQSRPDEQCGASWRGISLPFSRLHFGLDPRLVGMLSAQGIAPDVIAKIQDAAKLLNSQIVFDGMPLKDAVGFCRFILETTINSCTYEVGVPTCGGPLQIAMITRSKFSWISTLDY